MDGCVRARELEAARTLRCHGCWIERMGFGSPREHRAGGEGMGKVYRLPAFLLVREAHVLSISLYLLNDRIFEYGLMGVPWLPYFLLPFPFSLLSLFFF